MRRFSTVVVGGMALSGMSMSVVTPPAAAALVPVQNPSHSVRPGSLRCTWVSTIPGMSTSGEISRYRVLVGKLVRGSTVSCTAIILPLAGDMTSVAGEMRSPSTVRLEQSTKTSGELVIGSLEAIAGM